MKKSKILCFSISLIIFASFITLSLLGGVERKGYLSEFNLSDKINNEYLYVYHIRIKYYDKVFKHSDIYGVYPKSTNLPEYVESIDWDENGSPFGIITSKREITEKDKIDIAYTLKVKPDIAMYIVMSIFILLGICFKDKLLLWLKDPKRAFLIILSTFLALLVTFVFYNLSNANWTFGDDRMFLTSTAQGKYLGLMILINRFWPLGLYHANLLIPFGNNPFVYLLLNNIILVSMILCLFFIIKRYSNKLISIFFLFVMLTLPDIIMIYMSNIFSEPFLLFYISLFAIFYQKALDTSKKRYYILASIAALISTYYKEPIFGLYLVFSLTQLIFNYKGIEKKQKYFLSFLILNAIIFTSLYMWSIRDYSGAGYAAGRSGGLNQFDIFLLYAKGSTMLLLALLVSLVRSFYILIKKDKKLIVFDAYLFAGLAYTFAYVILKMQGFYYILPSSLCYLIAFSGYLNYLLKCIKNKNVTLNKNVIIFNKLAVIILIGVSLFILRTSYIKNINTAKNIVAGRYVTVHDTKLISALKEADFNIYMYYPNTLNDFPLIAYNWRYSFLRIFASFDIHNGKYEPDYLAIEKIFDDSDISNINNYDKNIILFDGNYSNNITKDNNPIELKLEDYSEPGTISLFDLKGFVSKKSLDEYTEILDDINDKYLR